MEDMNECCKQGITWSVCTKKFKLIGHRIECTAKGISPEGKVWVKSKKYPLTITETEALDQFKEYIYSLDKV